MLKQAFKYRLYPTRKQAELLTWTLDRCRELYNAALAERRDAYRMAGKQITFYDQSKQLPEIKECREEYKDIYSQVLQNVLHRLERASRAFFRRIKVGEKPGYPRFKSANAFDSFCYPQDGFSLTLDNHLCLSKIGSIKVKLHRPIEGTIKTCTVKRESEAWYVIFTCDAQAHPCPESDKAVGIDLGLAHFATLSTGETIENPRFLRRAEKKLARLQQALSRKKRGSRRRQKDVRHLSKMHRKIRNQRHDFLHKSSRQLINAYGLIVFEDLQISNLSKHPQPKQDENGAYLPNGASAKSGLNKSILDAGWGRFQAYCLYKAASAGRTVLLVTPNYTSQRCSGCGQIRKKELSERWHSCECGCELDRDHNAAINILRLGQSHQGQL